MDKPIEFWDMAIRLLAAAAFGAVVGWEREKQDKPAGLRTHMLVAIGAAGFTLVTWTLCGQLMAADDRFQLDPIRVVEGIIGGIGFLGAGAIIQSGGSVQGITTAAAIWVVGAVGVACGVGSYSIALLVVLTSVVTLYPLGYYESRLVSGDEADPGANEQA